MYPSPTEEPLVHPTASAGPVSRFLFPALLLILTAAASLWWSHYQLLWFDEILVQWTDSVPTAAQVADIQVHYPLSLDPVEFHEIEHAVLKIFGSGAFALRLSALIGFLIMQICLYIFARRIGGRIAGILALAFPAFTGALFYASNARPYGLILGFSALAMVCWQAAITPGGRRTGTLFVLAGALILAVNVHYYGFLIVAALFTAELTRTIVNRKADLPVWTALSVGACGFLFVLPTLGAARQFLPHLWDRKGATFSHVWRTYFITVPHFAVDHDSPRWMMALVVLGFLVLLGACLLSLRIWIQREMLPVTALILTLMALPILGFFSALLTHALEPRYLIITVLGVSCFVGVSLARWIPDRAAAAVTVILAIAVVLTGFAHARRERKSADKLLATFTVPPSIRNALLASPTNHLYTANAFLFSQMTEYEPDARVRSRLTLVYSEPEEVRFAHMDTFTLTALHMAHFSPLSTQSYESMAATPGHYLYLLRPIPDPPAGSFGSDWITTPSILAGATMQPLGKLGDGEVMLLSFPPPSK